MYCKPYAAQPIGATLQYESFSYITIRTYTVNAAQASNVFSTIIEAHATSTISMYKATRLTHRSTAIGAVAPHPSEP